MDWVSRVDLAGNPLHFWDPMVGHAALVAPVVSIADAGIAHTWMGMITTIITTTTRKRGAIG